MSPANRLDMIRVRGARQNNLKGIDVDLPTGRLIVVTGLSGSGKSSLAFDTLYAEGQRRYIETFSPYARQFFDRMDKPRVDAIDGIPPAIALEQSNSVRSTRSTVGTMTEINDYLKLVWAQIATLQCRQCDRPVHPEPPTAIWAKLRTDLADGTEILVTFSLPLTSKLTLAEQLSLVTKQGFQRALHESSVVRLDPPPASWSASTPAHLDVVQDRLKISANQRARFVEACEQAYHFGHGRLTVWQISDTNRAPQFSWKRYAAFSRHLHCASCDLEYSEPTPALFSFNHPLGACPQCKGFGRVIGIDDRLAIPDRTRSLADGAIKPWQTGTGAECQSDLVRAAKKAGVPLDVPFQQLAEHHQKWVIEGDENYGEGNEWPRAWYGLRGYFRYLESKAYKMHVRVLLSRYRSYRTCPACMGKRLRPDALFWRINCKPADSPGTEPLSFADFCQLPLDSALRVIERFQSRVGGNGRDAVSLALAEVRSRLRFLVEVGVGYLTLHRTTRSLSGGETQRVTLTTCLGSRLVHTLFVLDEPSVGLHPRDTQRLVSILKNLRDLGNSVVVVEHDPTVMHAADQILDLGPGHGDDGGRIVAQGTYAEIVRHPDSLTGAYLSGRRVMPHPTRREVRLPIDARAQEAATGSQARTRSATRKNVSPPVLELNDALPVRSPAPPTRSIRLEHVTRHNLRDLTVDIPLGRLVCLTGVSGSGKTTLASELLRLLRIELGAAVSSSSLEVRESESETETSDDDAEDLSRAPAQALLTGAAQIGSVLLVDQSPIGRTPRSNPAVYTGAFDSIRDVYAASPAARQRGLGSSAFSFNSAQGQCEQCRGAGFEKIEMQFLSDVFIRCAACEGRRYRPHVLDVHLPAAGLMPGRTELSIADVLELTIDDGIRFLTALGTSRSLDAARRLAVLQDVGLGYLRLGQPVNTLSGGESQRLKLAGHLASMPQQRGADAFSPPGTPTHTLFVFDEPTTGLHLEDIRVLLNAFQRLVDSGHSVLLVEHNLDTMRAADWIIDLGPEGGEGGGRVVVTGPPEVVAACSKSHTGAALRHAAG